MNLTKVLILLSSDFTDVMQFRIEFARGMNRFSVEEEWNKYEYIYLDTPNNNEIIQKSLNLLSLKQTAIAPDWLSTDSNFNNMFDYLIDADNCIIIDFQATYGFSKHKKKMYQEYSTFLNIYLIYFSLDSKPITCCSQILVYLNEELQLENDTFDFLRCDICGNQYVIYQELMNEYMFKTMYATILHRKSFLKGEFK